MKSFFKKLYRSYHFTNRPKMDKLKTQMIYKLKLLRCILNNAKNCKKCRCLHTLRWARIAYFCQNLGSVIQSLKRWKISWFLEKTTQFSMSIKYSLMIVEWEITSSLWSLKEYFLNRIKSRLLFIPAMSLAVSRLSHLLLLYQV